MIVDRYCAEQVVFFSVHEPALNAAAESLYVPIATKNFKTAPHLSTLRLQSYYLNARPYIGGHLTRLGNRQDVILQQAYVQDLKANSEAALAGLDPTPIFQQYGTQNPWELFKVYLDNVAPMAAEATLVKWQGQLGGADVFTFDNAAKMTESLRIESGILGPFGIRP